MIITDGLTLSEGYTIAGDASSPISFTLSSSDFSNGYPYNGYSGGRNYPYVLGDSGNEGFTLDFTYYATDNVNLIYVSYNPYVVSDFTSSRIPDFFNSLVTSGYFTGNNENAIWQVDWGPDSSIPSGYVSMTYANNSYLFMSPLDTTVSGWNTYPPNNNGTTSLAGTFKLPATFTLVQPIVNKINQWC